MNRHRLPASLIALAILLFVVAPQAHAEKKRKKRADQVVTYATPLKKRPGEASKTIVELEVGAEVEVMGRKGRWVRVRSGKKLGWVPRTTIEPRKEAGWGGETVGVDGARKSTDATATVIAVRRVKARSRPSKKRGKKLFSVRRNDELAVLDTKGKKWIQIENAKGEVGWIRTSAVEANDPDPDEDLVALVDPDDPDLGRDDETEPNQARMRFEKRTLEVIAQAALGISSYSRRFSSNGSSALGGYRISAGTMAATASAMARKHFGAMFVAVQADYGASVGAPGIRFQNEDGEVSDARSFHLHDVTASLEVGATFGKSHPVRVAAVGGYHLGYFVVTRIQDNPGLLARERLAGPQVGIMASTVVTRRVMVDAGFSWTPSASLSQTVNLEDGMDSEVWAIGGSAHASYLLDARHTIEVGYAGRRVKYNFSGQSTRQFDVTSARRKDIHHAFMVGIARAL